MHFSFCEFWIHVLCGSFIRCLHIRIVIYTLPLHSFPLNLLVLFVLKFTFSDIPVISSLTYQLLGNQFSSVAQSCPTLGDLMNHSTSGLPVHHQLLEFTQTHVHRVSDAIQPSHPLSSPSPSCPQSLPASGSFPMSQLFT